MENGLLEEYTSVMWKEEAVEANLVPGGTKVRALRYNGAEGSEDDMHK